MTLNQKMMLNRAVMDDPYPFYDALREAAPVWQASPQGIYTVTSFEMISEAARRVEYFSSVMRGFLYQGDDGILAKMPIELGEPTLAVADPPEHTQHKQMIFQNLYRNEWR